MLACSSGITIPRAQQSKQQDHPLLVAYFPQWGIYNQPQYFVKNLVESGGAALLDQVNYAQGSPKDGHCSLADPKADLNYFFTAKTSVDGRADSASSGFRGNFHQLEELKRRYPKLKILISLEGSADYFANDALPEHRQAFVASCVNLFIKGHVAPGIRRPGLFDGIDVDWEYPKASQADDYMALVAEFRRQLDAYRPGLRLTVAVGPSPKMYPGVDMARVSRSVNRIGVMNYDYAGPWSATTGIIAPLYAEDEDASGSGSVDASLRQYLAAGVKPGKLLMGLPFYGYGWSQVGSKDRGLNQQGLPISEDQPYSYVAGLMRNSVAYRSPRSKAPWLYDGNSFWTYEDPVSIAYKVDYAEHKRLGGLMIWELSGDSTGAPLLKAAYDRLAHPLPQSEASAWSSDDDDQADAGDAAFDAGSVNEQPAAASTPVSR